MMRDHLLVFASSALVLLLSACSNPAEKSTAVDSTSHREYGASQKVGNGTVRTYIIYDDKNAGAPVEVGVAMSEAAMDGLPAGVAMPGDQAKSPEHASMNMANMNMYLLDLPAKNPTQYRFVQFDW